MRSSGWHSQDRIRVLKIRDQRTQFPPLSLTKEGTREHTLRRRPSMGQEVGSNQEPNQPAPQSWTFQLPEF